MPIAAAPEYMGSDFKSASPALRFGMYLKIWDRSWNKPSDKQPALDHAVSLNPYDRKVMKAFVDRQQALFDRTGTSGLQLTSVSVAPFATGLGNEHPLENGFAFLNPYGLPYLPGSSIKGVLRRAAEELAHEAFFKDGIWTLPAIWHLFGFEPWRSPENRKSAAWSEWVDGFTVSPIAVEKYLNALDKQSSMSQLGEEILSSSNPLHTLMEARQLHVRGALQFWDVMPQIKSKSLTVEVMTPHYSHYYREREHGGGKSPHDSGSPNPILFLTVPPESSFTFHVVCDQKRLERTAPELAKDDGWKTLLQGAFEHAFDWLGFGAKTAVGYGSMKRDRAGEEEIQKEREERKRTERERAKQAQAEKERKEQEEKRLAELTPVEREVDTVIRNRQHRDMTEIAAVIRAVRDGRWSGDEKIEVAKWLENKMREGKCWKETSAKKRPDKDKDYQSTLTVKGWLEGM